MRVFYFFPIYPFFCFLLIFVDFDCFVVYNHKYAVLGILSFSNNKIFIVKYMMLYISYTKFAIGVCVVGVLRKIYSQIYIKWRLPILYSIFALYVFDRILCRSTISNFSSWGIVNKLCIGCIALLLCAYLCVDIFSRKTKITGFMVVGFICSTAICIFGNVGYQLIILMLLLYTLKGADFKSIVKVFLISLSLGIFCVLLLCLTNLIPDVIVMRLDKERHSLGLGNPNNMHLYFFLLLSALNFLLLRKKFFCVVLIIEIILNYGIYCIDYCRTGFLLTYVMIFFMFIGMLLYSKRISNYLQKSGIKDWFLRGKTNKIISILLALLPLCYVLGFGLLVFLWKYNLDWVSKINHLLSGRIYLVYKAFCDHSITLFGEKGVQWCDSSGNYTGLDSAFFNYLFNGGIIEALIFLMLSSYLFYKLGREKRWGLVVVLFVILLYSISESVFLSVDLNVFLLVLIEQDIGGKILYGDIKEEKCVMENNELSETT